VSKDLSDSPAFALCCGGIKHTPCITHVWKSDLTLWTCCPHSTALSMNYYNRRPRGEDKLPLLASWKGVYGQTRHEINMQSMAVIIIKSSRNRVNVIHHTVQIGKCHFFYKIRFVGQPMAVVEKVCREGFWRSKRE